MNYRRLPVEKWITRRCASARVCKVSESEPMNLVHSLIDRFFGSPGEELHVGGVPITLLAERHGTPLFVYDRAVMDSKLKALRHVLPPEFDVYYSVKANPNIAILHHFVQLGCGLEVASAG